MHSRLTQDLLKAFGQGEIAYFKESQLPGKVDLLHDSVVREFLLDFLVNTLPICFCHCSHRVGSFNLEGAAISIGP